MTVLSHNVKEIQIRYIGKWGMSLLTVAMVIHTVNEIHVDMVAALMFHHPHTQINKPGRGVHLP